MKIGFLVNLTLLLCFVCSQLLLWLIDGTLVRCLAQLLNSQTQVLQEAAVGGKLDSQRTRKAKEAQQSDQSLSLSSSESPSQF